MQGEVRGCKGIERQVEFIGQRRAEAESIRVRFQRLR